MRLRGNPSRLLLALILAGTAAAAQAVEFDERVKAPSVTEPAAFRAQADSFKQRVRSLKEAGPRELMMNRALFAERFDLTWQLQRAMNARRPLGDLAEVGFVSRGDGSYAIDYEAHPEWHRLDEAMAGWLPLADWTTLGAELRARGFRESDITALQEYVRTHDARGASARSSLPLAISFSKVVKKLDRVKRPVPDNLVLSYLYQRSRADAEATREWAEGLLQALDPQRARILLSYFDEMKFTGVIAPDDQRGGIDELLKLMRQPNFEQLATAEAKEGTP
jgi:hypothetical protein